MVKMAKGKTSDVVKTNKRFVGVWNLVKAVYPTRRLNPTPENGNIIQVQVHRGLPVTFVGGARYNISGSARYEFKRCILNLRAVICRSTVGVLCSMGVIGCGPSCPGGRTFPGWILP